MKLSQMKAFREVMLTGSVSEAARNLNRTQPSVSAMISAFEDQIGMKLFERRNGRLHAVPEARYLLEECSAVLQRVQNIRSNVRGIQELKAGRLEVASMPGPSVLMLPDAASSFFADKPEVELVLTSRSSEQVFQLIAAQQFDLGLADYVEGKPEETTLVVAKVFQFECLCAIPMNHPLALKPVISPADLAGQPMATLFDNHETTVNLSRVMAEAEVVLRQRFIAQYFIPLLTFCERNLAIGLVDPIAAHSYGLLGAREAPLVFRPISPTITYRAMLLTPAFRPATLLAEAFAEQISRQLENLGGKRIASPASTG